MGTNYFLEESRCECCGRRGDRVHIGKSHYMFRAYVPSVADCGGPPSAVGAVLDFKGWKHLILELCRNQGWQVIDEYGREHEPIEFLASCHRYGDDRANERRWGTGAYAGSPSNWCREGVPGFSDSQYADRWWWIDSEGFEMNAYEFS